MSRSMMTVGTVTVAMIGLALGMLVMRMANAPVAIAQDASKSQSSVVPNGSFIPNASGLQQTPAPQAPIANQRPAQQTPAIPLAALDGEAYLTPEERRAAETAAFKAETRNQVTMLAVGGAVILLAGLFAPASFMSHFIVFVLSCFVGFQVIWNVSHSLHTPLMAVTNAISSIIILGALMQIGSGNWLVVTLAALSVFMAGINIFGGFMVTRRMLAMFQKS